MDIFRTLQSILAPGAIPVNRSRPVVPVTETQAGQRTFAQTLEEAAGSDPTIAPFGVVPRQPIPTLPAAPVAVARPQIDAQAPGTANPNGVAVNGTGAPVVDPPARDLPIDRLHVEIGATMQSVFIKEPEILTGPEPLLPPPDADPAPVETKPPAAAGPKPPQPIGDPAPGGVTAPSAPMLPPIGVPWPARTAGGTGFAAPGIASTDAQVSGMMQLKFDYYTDPVGHGVSECDEGRMFLDAVNRGYVPKTPEGLASLLSWNGMGDYDRDLIPTGRPVEISNYFSGWYRGTLPA